MSDSRTTLTGCRSRWMLVANQRRCPFSGVRPLNVRRAENVEQRGAVKPGSGDRMKAGSATNKDNDIGAEVEGWILTDPKAQKRV